MEIAILVVVCLSFLLLLSVHGRLSELDKRQAVWEAVANKAAPSAEESTDGDQRS